MRGVFSGRSPRVSTSQSPSPDWLRAAFRALVLWHFCPLPPPPAVELTSVARGQPQAGSRGLSETVPWQPAVGEA